MSIKTPPEAIKREALMFGVMAGVIATTAMSLIGGINFLISALVGIILVVVVFFIIVQLGAETPPPRGEGNPDIPERAPASSTPAASPAPASSPSDPSPTESKAAPNMPEPVVVEPSLQSSPPTSPASGDGALGEQPETLNSARESGPDDLKQIKGVGPKLEELLHSMGIYHFDQIAAWTPAHVAWMDENLQGFKGRVSRDDWVIQARTLASA